MAKAAMVVEELAQQLILLIMLVPQAEGEAVVAADNGVMATVVVMVHKEMPAAAFMAEVPVVMHMLMVILDVFTQLQEEAELCVSSGQETQDNSQVPA
jgi:hypothetical protein